MAWKNEKITLYFDVVNEDADKFYQIARRNVSIGDIKADDKTIGGVLYKINIKKKNLTRFFSDIQIAKICGLWIKQVYR